MMTAKSTLSKRPVLRITDALFFSFLASYLLSDPSLSAKLRVNLLSKCFSTRYKVSAH